MKFINYLKAISGVEIYPMISLFIFVVFFALLIFWAIKANKNLILGIKIFLIGIFLNEFVLGLMGVFSIYYISVPYSPEILVIVSALVMSGLALMWTNLKINKDKKLLE